MKNVQFKEAGMKLAKKMAERQMGKGNSKIPPICGIIFYQPKRPNTLKKDRD